MVGGGGATRPGLLHAYRLVVVSGCPTDLRSDRFPSSSQEKETTGHACVAVQLLLLRLLEFSSIIPICCGVVSSIKKLQLERTILGEF